MFYKRIFFMKKLYVYFIFFGACTLEASTTHKKEPSALDRRYEIEAATFNNPYRKLVFLNESGTKAHLRIYDPTISKAHYLHYFLSWNGYWKITSIIPQTVHPDSAADATTQEWIDELEKSGRW